jgi:hypothetical protein
VTSWGDLGLFLKLNPKFHDHRKPLWGEKMEISLFKKIIKEKYNKLL